MIGGDKKGRVLFVFESLTFTATAIFPRFSSNYLIRPCKINKSYEIGKKTSAESVQYKTTPSPAHVATQHTH